MATNQKDTRRGATQGGSLEQHRQAGQQSHRDGDRKNAGENQAQQNQNGNQGQGGHRWSPEEAREQGKKGGQSRSKSS